jgi:hypothetical protein
MWKSLKITCCLKACTFLSQPMLLIRDGDWMENLRQHCQLCFFLQIFNSWTKNMLFHSVYWGTQYAADILLTEFLKEIRKKTTQKDESIRGGFYNNADYSNSNIKKSLPRHCVQDIVLCTKPCSQIFSKFSGQSSRILKKK